MTSLHETTRKGIDKFSNVFSIHTKWFDIAKNNLNKSVFSKNRHYIMLRMAKILNAYIIKYATLSTNLQQQCLETNYWSIEYWFYAVS